MENPPGWRVDVQKQHLAKPSVIFVSDTFLSAVYHSVAKQCFDWYKSLHCKQRGIPHLMVCYMVVWGANHSVIIFQPHAVYYITFLRFHFSMKQNGTECFVALLNSGMEQLVNVRFSCKLFSFGIVE